MSTSASPGDVARLLGRVGFGATEADLETWTGKPYAELVDHLLAVPALADRAPALDEPYRAALEANRSIVDPTALAYWWLERMRTTAYPLEERLTLVWHGHFATALRDTAPNGGTVMQQNQTLRRHALGDFRSLCAAMTVDPAMLMWLNGADNVAGRPNENYARELMELFCLGTAPQVYGEQDVREAARALTGWVTDDTTRVARFDTDRHDRGTKSVLGVAIADGGDREYLSVVDSVLRQPEAPVHVARALVRALAYIPAEGDPLVTQVAGVLRASGWQLRPALRTMLLAPEFRSTDPGRRLVRPPAVVVVAACRALGVVPGYEMHPLLERMGQTLLRPPNVAGWKGGTSWLSATSALGHYDWGLDVARLHRNNGPSPLPPPGDLDAWARRLGVDAWSSTTTTAVRQYVVGRIGAPIADVQEGVLALLLSSPDWLVL